MSAIQATTTTIESGVAQSLPYLCEWGTAETGCIRRASHALAIPVDPARVNVFCTEHATYFNPQYMSLLEPGERATCGGALTN
jgi:hypothetical protein